MKALMTTLRDKDSSGEERYIYPKTVAKQVITDSESEFISKELKDTLNKRSTVTLDNPVEVAIGGFNEGDTVQNMPVNEVLAKLLSPNTDAQIEVIATEEPGYFPKQTSKQLTNIHVNINVIKYPITKLEIKINDESKKVVEDESISNGGSFDYPFEETFSTDTDVTIIVTDTKPNTYTFTLSYKFVDPFYYGALNLTSEETAPTAEEIKSLGSSYEGKDDKNVKFNTTDNYIVFAYPKSYGELSSILDQNGFENKNAFTVHTVTVPNEQQEDVEYFVYVHGPSTVIDFGMVFKFQ